MNAWRGRGSIAAIAVLLALSGCGGSSTPPTTGSTGSGTGPTSAAPQKKASGPSGSLKLTGFWTYDGPFTGQFDCYHNSKGYFELEGQAPYLMDVTAWDMHEGTFKVNPQDPKTGFSPQDPGQPRFDVRRLDPDDPNQPDAPTMRQNGGTITFANGGDTGTLIADYVNVEDASQAVHAELHWKDCPLSR